MIVKDTQIKRDRNMYSVVVNSFIFKIKNTKKYDIFIFTVLIFRVRNNN